MLLQFIGEQTGENSLRWSSRATCLMPAIVKPRAGTLPELQKLTYMISDAKYAAEHGL